MSAGTITLANNSNAVAGDGTAFTTELVAGDFIVVTTGGVTYTLPVKSIESDTALTLARNYNGPAVTAGAWTAMPRDTLNRISAQIAADTAYAIRQRVLEIDNWYQLLEVNGDVTIKMADGSSYTGPSWLSIKDTLALIDIDEVTALANQVRTDAQQVATDKGAAQSAAQAASEDASTASNAKTAAVTAQGKAETAQNASETAQGKSEAAQAKSETARAAAEAAASSVHPENLLHKDQNLDDLADKSAARGHLEVYSKSEVYSKTESDNKSATTNARMAYALVDAGTISLNTRTVFNNPFGINTPVYVVVEAQISGKWAPTGWVTTVSGTQYYSYGLTAGFVANEGIIVQSGTNGVSGQPSAITGGLHGLTNLPSASAPVRIHVWKITA
ncbi:TPA: hypothetical protein JAV82_002917 [Kluyvera ascorbata]|nr:hypothetical protein STW0522KLE44_30860 [Klebsiella sp. STW0522-44]HAT7515123.1 hypothetical protein [Kluyvera ascorbata]